MKFKKLSLLSMAIVFVPLLSGCWDKVELEEEGYVAAIGIDEGKNNSIVVTFQITNPKAGASNTAGGTKGGSEKTSDIISVEAPGILVAQDLVSTTITRRISLSHSKVIIVSEKFAKTDTFFHILEAALRDKEMRRSMNVMITREDAFEFISKNNPTLDERPHKFYEFMAKRWKDTGFVPPYSNINRFMQRTEQGESLFLFTYGTTKDFIDKHTNEALDYLPGQLKKQGVNPTEIIGAAVFKEGKMIGRLSGEEVRLVSLMRPKPEAKSMLFTFPDPLAKNKNISGRLIKQKRTKVKMDLSGANPKINVTVPVTIEILGITGFTDYPENLSKQGILKNSIAEYLEKESINLVKKTQVEFEGEPFLWELSARGEFYNYDDYKAYKWMKTYKGAEVSIKYDVKIKGFGKQLNPPKMNENKFDKKEGIELPDK